MEEIERLEILREEIEKLDKIELVREIAREIWKKLSVEIEKIESQEIAKDMVREKLGREIIIVIRLKELEKLELGILNNLEKLKN